MSAFLRLAGVLAIVLWSVPASAHVPIPGVGGFPGGLLHPVLVPAHALGLVALALFLAQQRARFFAVLSFAAALAAGLYALTFAVGETPAVKVLLADTALIGIVVAAAWTPPKPLGWIVAAIAGAAIGLDSPPDAVTILEGNLMLLGTFVGACLALALTVAGASLLRQPWQRLGLRIVGSWIAASALLVLALTLR